MSSEAEDLGGVVVVGAGLAAAHALDGLREGGYPGRLTLVGDEGELPYERPPLSKEVLTGSKEPGSAYVHDRDWYTERDITLRLDDAAVDIDPERRRVTLVSGAVLPYTELVLATGASPRTVSLPGVELDGVRTLRNLADSVRVRSAFEGATDVVVIGAGWIGLEVAAAAKTAGANVTVLESAPSPLAVAMGPTLGAHFARLHTRNGVDLRAAVSVESIEGSGGRVTGVRVGGEMLPADLVVIGVGATPNTALAEKAGIEVDDGVVVDESLRTSAPHIFAIGDVANARNTALDSRLRVEHWDNAIRQGKLVARVILGGDDTYDWQPYFYTDQFDLGMEYVGHSSPDDDAVIRGDQDSGEFIAFWLRNGAISAAMNVNVWDVSDQLRALIGKTVDPARLADETVEIAELAG